MDKKFAQNQMDKKCVHQVVILVAPGFDEESVIHCLCQMRQRGTAVALVGVPSNLVTGVSGLVVHPDYSLTQLYQAGSANSHRLLILPGGAACATALLSDPRVHHIIKKTFTDGGLVATTSSIVPQILTNIGIVELTNTHRFLAQGTQNRSDFIGLLIDHIMI